MANVQDVASYILKKCGPMTAMKLQKLVYYCQAWSLVWDERALFAEPIEAWANGPVCPDLYRMHAGKFRLQASDINGSADAIDQTGAETIDAVLKFYCQHNAQWLSDLTHSEDPWKNARVGIPDGDRGAVEIKHAAMAEYYGGLP